ncbi:SEC-C domain-containing protein [Brevundimonas sp.]|uniref:SEC-C domain-containing protein n=1 Tax=Brevundimonas sp. TaxID=1871086 RepID=UPI00289E39E7|nr:SEC-C domain-containing protein [Brevundimonas sp.]
MSKLGRNQKCHCGSGRKFKHCCLGFEMERTAPPEMKRAYAAHLADEAIRRRQQGFGKPIIAVQHGDHQIVAVNNRIMWSKKWQTFPDFLLDYIKDKLTLEWGARENEKALADRHPIMQWHAAFIEYQKRFKAKAGQINSAPVTGVVVCYLGLAYSLYLMDHNADLQAKMLARLRDPAQFQGAFFEMMIASALIRAGYELLLEDEDSRQQRHCEFAAVKTGSGKRYTVEAKSRAVSGLLGRTDNDGGRDNRPFSKLKTHLHDALDKPSDHERLVFIDINAPLGPEGDLPNGALVLRAVQILEQYEGHPDAPKESAYVFVVNMAFHRALESDAVLALAPLGFRIDDFNKTGEITVIEQYRRNLKHSDALEVARSLASLHEFPITFDGSLASETLLGGKPRIKIGQAYDFGGPDEPFVGIVRSATVLENTRECYIVAETAKGNHILSEKMDDASFEDWQANKAAYFGEIQDVPTNAQTPYEMYERFMDMFADFDRKGLATQIGKAPDDPSLAHLDDNELREYISDGFLRTLLARRPAKTVVP